MSDRGYDELDRPHHRHCPQREDAAEVCGCAELALDDYEDAMARKGER